MRKRGRTPLANKWFAAQQFLDDLRKEVEPE